MSLPSTEKRTIHLSSFGTSKASDHELQYDWSQNGKEISVQGGGSGVVFTKEGGYTTAFFEAFPHEPKCFIRGEGSDIAAAETQAWEKFQKILVCEHEMERRNRTDGYGYCKHCSYASMVFEPLTKCCKCGTPTAYSQDFRGKWYCKKHRRIKPKNPNPERWELFFESDKRLPRKLKKKYKEAFLHDLWYRNGIKEKHVKHVKGTYRIRGKSYSANPFSYEGVKKYVREVLRNKRMYLKYLKRKQHV